MCIPVLLAAQSSPSANDKTVAAVATLRQEMMDNCLESTPMLRELSAQLNGKNIPDPAQSSFLLNIWKSHVVDGYPYKTLVRLAQARISRTERVELLEVFTENALAAIRRNADLIDLINEGIVKKQFPYPVDQTTSLFTEFQEYGIADGMRVAEIGAGSGIISILLGTVYKNMTIYVNDLDGDFIRYLNGKIKRTRCIDPTNQMVVVKGKKKNTGLEGKALDVILIRDTFHHFSKKPEMIRSIKRSLQPGGTVVLVETLPELDTDSVYCGLALSKSQILELMEAGGFSLTGERQIGEEIILKFRLIQQ